MEAGIASRDLRNDVSAVLRRVEAGESLLVNVSGRPVARLTPLAARPQTMPTPVLLDLVRQGAADPGLTHDLATILTDTTDDVG
jgi:prevent-host-death family protein